MITFIKRLAQEILVDLQREATTSTCRGTDGPLKDRLNQGRNKLSLRRSSRADEPKASATLKLHRDYIGHAKSSSFNRTYLKFKGWPLNQQEKWKEQLSKLLGKTFSHHDHMELPSHIKKRKRRPTLCIQLISKIKGTVKTQNFGFWQTIWLHICAFRELITTTTELGSNIMLLTNKHKLINAFIHAGNQKICNPQGWIPQWTEDEGRKFIQLALLFEDRTQQGNRPDTTGRKSVHTSRRDDVIYI